MTQPKVAIAITADDRTAKGAKSAEKRIGQIPKHAGGVAGSVTRSSRTALRTLGAVEQASARVFGGRSLTSGITSRLGAVREAASAAGTGMGEAASAGGALEGAMTGLGVVAGATVGILAAAGYAAFKLATGWAEGAASIGRTSEIIGVGTKALQEFTAAAERAGISKDKAVGGLGGLSKTLNDARYGRNRDALAVLGKLGVELKLKDDGDVDVAAMVPAIAEAMSRQTSSGKRTVADKLGVAQELIPFLSQGAKQIAADMADADQHAPMISDEDVGVGKRMQRRHAIASQVIERETVSRFGRYAAEGTDKAEGWVVSQFSGGAGAVERGGKAIERAAGRFTAGQIAALARKAVPLQREARRYFPTEAQATGVASVVVLESAGNDKARERGGKGYGLIQWTDKARREEFKRAMGVYPEQASRDQQWRMMRYETEHKEKATWRRALEHGEDAGAIADGYTRHVIRPLNKDRDGAERAAVADQLTIMLHVHGLPPGAGVKASSGGGTRPAISHAFAR